MDGGRVVTMSTRRDAVHQRYRAAALRIVEAGGCCGDAGCCDPASTQEACGAAYSAEELAEVGLDPGVSLGCGNPLLLAELHTGEVVLDLGSGGGLDVL